MLMRMATPPCVARLMPAGAPRVRGFEAIQTIVRIADQRDAGNEILYPALVSLGICQTVSSISRK